MAIRASSLTVMYDFPGEPSGREIDFQSRVQDYWDMILICSVTMLKEKELLNWFWPSEIAKLLTLTC